MVKSTEVAPISPPILTTGTEIIPPNNEALSPNKRVLVDPAQNSATTFLGDQETQQGLTSIDVDLLRIFEKYPGQIVPSWMLRTHNRNGQPMSYHVGRLMTGLRGRLPGFTIECVRQRQSSGYRFVGEIEFIDKTPEGDEDLESEIQQSLPKTATQPPQRANTSVDFLFPRRSRSRTNTAGIPTKEEGEREAIAKPPQRKAEARVINDRATHTIGVLRPLKTSTRLPELPFTLPQAPKDQQPSIEQLSPPSLEELGKQTQYARIAEVLAYCIDYNIDPATLDLRLLQLRANVPSHRGEADNQILSAIHEFDIKEQYGLATEREEAIARILRTLDAKRLIATIRNRIRVEIPSVNLPVTKIPS